MPVDKSDILRGLGTDLDKALDSGGIDARELVRRLKDELDFLDEDGQLSATAMGIRQRARMDIHRLRGDYPAEKRELSGPEGQPLPTRPIIVEFIKTENGQPLESFRDRMRLKGVDGEEDEGRCLTNSWSGKGKRGQTLKD